MRNALANADGCSGNSENLSSDILQAVGPLIRRCRRTAPVVDKAKPEGAEQHYRNGLLKMSSGDAEGALQEFDKALTQLPTFADAIVARAELLDSKGQWEAARKEYDRARRLTAEMPTAGAPDRRYLFRRRSHFAFEIEAYELVRNNVSNKILPQLAHGNPLLACGRAKEALDSYKRALRVKPDMPELQAMKGEALSALGLYEGAIQAFNRALAALPTDAETLNASGIARMALGQIAEANHDWRRQLEFVPKTQPAAHACVAMRQGDYQIAFSEFGQALAKEPANAYWLLYRLTAGLLIGAAADAVTYPAERQWPTALLAIHAGQATEPDVLGKADTPSRRSEAPFQIGVVALAGNTGVARRCWGEVVERGAPTLIEYAAARNQLARLGL
jgi:Tfp pilus assembly protein PilF